MQWLQNLFPIIGLFSIASGIYLQFSRRSISAIKLTHLLIESLSLSPSYFVSPGNTHQFAIASFTVGQKFDQIGNVVARILYSDSRHIAYREVDYALWKSNTAMPHEVHQSDTEAVILAIRDKDGNVSTIGHAFPPNADSYRYAASLNSGISYITVTLSYTPKEGKRTTQAFRFKLATNTEFLIEED